METKRIVSYSQYSIYTTCPYSWYLRYIKRIPGKPSIHLVFGTSLHETLQEWLKTMYTISGKAADDLDLVRDFKIKFIAEYKKRVVGNNNEHFSTATELQEFYEDGVAIIEWLTKKRKQYFSIKNTELIGIEIPILAQATDSIANVQYKGAIDFVLYNKLVDTYTIYDIKTSTRGWTADDKKDQKKINQILLYKKMFSEIKKVPEENIEVVFFIVKRKLPEISEYPAKRIQEFIPAHGKIKVKKAHEEFQKFLTECFEPTGEYRDIPYYKNVGSACKWCQFNSDTSLCDKKN